MAARTISLAAAALLLSTHLSQAAVRNFFTPEVDGRRLDSCLADSQGCGKPTADAFCRMQGFDVALLFQREAVGDTIRLANGGLCSGPTCSSFKQIKCATLTPASAQ